MINTMSAGDLVTKLARAVATFPEYSGIIALALIQ